MADAIASLSGPEKDRGQYEQLMQRLAELLVIRQVCRYFGGAVNVEWEPVVLGSKKNPELTVGDGTSIVGIEVKAPALLAHVAARGKNPTQIASRFAPSKVTLALAGEKPVTLPRDNPLKDFLASADEKFRPFREQNPEFRGVLVIVWDDFIYEPISALIHANAGLFTENSFAKNADGSPVRFDNVDAVVVVRHLHQFARAAGDESLVDTIREPLDYGEERAFPPKALVVNPRGRGIPDPMAKCLQAFTPTPEMGAEYMPQDLVWWLNTNADK